MYQYQIIPSSDEGAGCCTSEQRLLDSWHIGNRCSAMGIAIVAVGNNLNTYGLRLSVFDNLLVGSVNFIFIEF